MRVGTFRALVAAAVTIAALLPLPLFAEGFPLVVSPKKWEFGSLRPGSRALLTLQVANTGPRAVTVTIIPTCDCLSTSVSKQVVPAGGRVSFRLSFLAEGEEAGFVRESYIVLADAGEPDHFYYQVHGWVGAAGEAGAP
jgi:hypothetical protein